jgi:hypothetical protein
MGADRILAATVTLSMAARFASLTSCPKLASDEVKGVILSSAARVASLTSQAKLAYDEIQSVGWRA